MGAAGKGLQAGLRTGRSQNPQKSVASFTPHHLRVQQSFLDLHSLLGRHPACHKPQKTHHHQPLLACRLWPGMPRPPPGHLLFTRLLEEIFLWTNFSCDIFLAQPVGTFVPSAQRSYSRPCASVFFERRPLHPGASVSDTKAVRSPVVHLVQLSASFPNQCSTVTQIHIPL